LNHPNHFLTNISQLIKKKSGIGVKIRFFIKFKIKNLAENGIEELTYLQTQISTMVEKQCIYLLEVPWCYLIWATKSLQ